MVSNNNSEIRPTQNTIKPQELPPARKNNTLEKMGPQKWVDHLENIISESGIDIHNHTNEAINNFTDRNEILEFSKDLYKLIDVSKETFGKEPSIVDLCKKMNNLAFSLVFKFTGEDNKKESLVILGSKDKNSDLNQLPRELIDIIAKNMFEAKLKASVDSFRGIE